MVAFYLFGTRRKNAAGVFAAGGRAVGGKRSNHFVELNEMVATTPTPMREVGAMRSIACPPPNSCSMCYPSRRRGLSDRAAL